MPRIAQSGNESLQLDDLATLESVSKSAAKLLSSVLGGVRVCVCVGGRGVCVCVSVFDRERVK